MYVEALKTQQSLGQKEVLGKAADSPILHTVRLRALSRYFGVPALCQTLFEGLVNEKEDSSVTHAEVSTETVH